MDPAQPRPAKMIERKKAIYTVAREFDQYLVQFGRSLRLPIDYEDLFRYSNALALYDKDGEDTLWTTVSYSPHDQEDIHASLLAVYALLRAEGDSSFMRHLYVDRIDLCLYGNTKPFRIRIVNGLNDNFDYFYVKEADASRIFGLELEHILSPNRIGFLCFRSTLIEEHIYGVPGDMFQKRYWSDAHLNEVRLAKEFVKFNERCFLRLLGDMHAANFIVDVTLDFDANTYRLRAIDFDQQSYEGRKNVYLPQFFKANLAYVDLAIKHLHAESICQYQREERSLMRRRMKAAAARLGSLLDIMHTEALAPPEHVRTLREELADHYHSRDFLAARTMGDLVRQSLTTLDLKL